MYAGGFNDFHQHWKDEFHRAYYARRETRRGPKYAVRPPWAPAEPAPLVIPPALLPGLVDLAEQAGMVVEVRHG